MSNSDHVIMCNGDLLLQLACNLLDAPELRRVGEHLVQLAYDVEKAERLERKREWLRDQQDGHDDSAADADPAPEVEDSNAAEDFAWETIPTNMRPKSPRLMRRSSSGGSSATPNASIGSGHFCAMTPPRRKPAERHEQLPGTG